MQVRIVAASPSDVARERRHLQAVIDSVHKGMARDRKLQLTLHLLETDARPGVHPEGPQG